LKTEEHAKLHESDFIKYARIGSKLGNESFRKRLVEKGPTQKELENWKRLGEFAKKGLHRIPHTDNTKKIISDNKKKFYENKENHPLWGKTKYEVLSPEGDIYYISGGWREWCESKGLNASNLRNVALGKRKNHKGWKARIIND
jgi:hypothetical protein